MIMFSHKNGITFITREPPHKNWYWYCFKEAHQIKELVQIPTFVNFQFFKAPLRYDMPGREGILEQNMKQCPGFWHNLYFCVSVFASQKKSPGGWSAGRRYACASPTCATASTLLPRLAPAAQAPAHWRYLAPPLSLWCPVYQLSERQTKCESNPRQMIFSNLTIIDVFPLVLMLWLSPEHLSIFKMRSTPGFTFNWYHMYNCSWSWSW